MKRLGSTIFALCLFTSVFSAQDYKVVFEGRPIRKIQTSFESGIQESPVSADDGFKYSVRIVERGGKYYWASRGMAELTRHEGGSYITFSALNGSGYIRIGIPFLLDLMDKLPADQRSKEIGYAEHLLTQFNSITYYGNRFAAR